MAWAVPTIFRLCCCYAIIRTSSIGSWIIKSTTEFARLLASASERTFSITLLLFQDHRAVTGTDSFTSSIRTLHWVPHGPLRLHPSLRPDSVGRTFWPG